METDQIREIARTLKNVHPGIPFTILAFFPEYRMKAFRAPTVEEMVDAYREARAVGLENIRLGNLGVFVRSEKDEEVLLSHVGNNAL